MNNTIYDKLKWVAMVVLPGLATFVGTIGSSLNWEHTQIATTIIAAAATFLGTCLGISAYKYNKE